MYGPLLTISQHYNGYPQTHTITYKVKNQEGLHWNVSDMWSPLLHQALCDCLGIPCHEDPVQLCLTSDHLSDKARFWHVTADVMQSLTQWWQSLTERRGEDASMTEQLYEDLIAR